MKKRTIALMLSVLAVMMLVGVGFATWVISQGDSSSAQANIVVDTVTDERVYASAAVAPGSKDSFIFGYDDSDVPTYDWLSNDDDTKEQNLTVTFRVTVKDRENNPVDDATVVPTLQILKPGATPDADPVAVTLPDWIVTPVLTQANIVNNHDGTYDLTVTFAWAAALNNSNPYQYFNGGKSDGNDRLAGLDPANYETNADAALKVLKDIEAVGADVYYKVTFAVSK